MLTIFRRSFNFLAEENASVMPTPAPLLTLQGASRNLVAILNNKFWGIQRLVRLDLCCIIIENSLVISCF